jgi:drug/metabolite transporter (DMT)-like permease
MGIIIILRPGQGVFEGAMMFALAGAFLGAVMMIMVRKLTASDSNVVMMTYPSMAIVLATSVPAYIFWITPTSHELLLLLLMSFMGISGQWCIIQAFRLGEATAVAPANYMRIVFATILGYYFFSEIPDIMSAAGTLIIIVSNFYLIYYEGRAIKHETGERIPGDVT